MRRAVVTLNVSLDGFADHTVAVVADDELHDFAREMLERADTVALGRVTYELLAAYWPDARNDRRATPGMLRFADQINAARKVVFSKSLKNVYWPNSRLITDDAVSEVRRMRQEVGRDIAIGGLKLTRALLQQGLIDEFCLMVQPVVMGRGRRLFEGDPNPKEFRLVETQQLRSGVVVLRYDTGMDQR
jgi:dihydrofolate reductase